MFNIFVVWVTGNVPVDEQLTRNDDEKVFERYFIKDKKQIPVSMLK